MSINGGPDVVSNGLIMYFDAANHRSHIGTGTTLYDLVGNISGSQTDAVFSGNKNGIINFDGAGDYVYLTPTTSGNDYKIQWPLTISSWFILNNLTAGGAHIFCNSDESNFYRGVRLSCFPSGDTWRVEVTYGNGAGESAGSRRSYVTSYYFQFNKWYHMAATLIDSTTAELWVNGSADTSFGYISGTANTMVYSTGSARLGGRAGTTQWLDGSIATLSMYNRRLNAKEALYNYNALKSRFE